MNGNKALEFSLWVASGLLAALFFVVGGATFIGLMDEQFTAWGYTLDVAAMIGIIEMLGAAGLLFPRTAGWSALGLMVLMLGAIWTLASHHQYVAMTYPIATFIVLGYVIWGRGLVWQTRDVARHEPGTT